jgi:DNA polymerase III delta prime subunit
MWFDKYRPTSLDEMSLIPEYKEYFESVIEKQDIPNMILTGQAGSGKTTLVKILTSSIPCTVLELNGSSRDRGIDTMRGRVASFASSLSKNMNIVFIDEADGLTSDAQDALKNTIEQFHKTCRFIFTGNNIHKFTEPIKSRCTKFHFEQFPKRKLLKLCKDILDKEEVEYENKEILSVIEHTYPDIRSCINMLEYCSHTGTFVFSDKKEFQSDYKEVVGYIESGDLVSIFRFAEKCNDFESVYRYLITEYAKDKNKPEISLTTAEWYGSSGSVVDKAITFIGMCTELMGVVGVAPKFVK